VVLGLRLCLLNLQARVCGCLPAAVQFVLCRVGDGLKESEVVRIGRFNRGGREGRRVEHESNPSVAVFGRMLHRDGAEEGMVDSASMTDAMMLYVRGLEGSRETGAGSKAV